MKKIMELLQNMKAKNEKKDNKGFSLVELIIVIAILVGIVGTQVLPYINKSKESKDYQIINSYGTAATTAYTSAAEKITAETTITMYTEPSDANEKEVYNEIISLTGYKDLNALKNKMGSKKGKNITKIVITINPTDTDSADAKAKTIVTQAYSTGNDAKGTEGKFLDPVVTQL